MRKNNAYQCSKTCSQKNARINKQYCLAESWCMPWGSQIPRLTAFVLQQCWLSLACVSHASSSWHGGKIHVCDSTSALIIIHPTVLRYFDNKSSFLLKLLRPLYFGICKVSLDKYCYVSGVHNCTHMSRSSVNLCIRLLPRLLASVSTCYWRMTVDWLLVEFTQSWELLNSHLPWMLKN